MKGDRIYLTGYYGYGTDASDAGDLEKMMYRVACYNRQDGTVLWHREMKAAELEACFQELDRAASAGKTTCTHVDVDNENRGCHRIRKKRNKRELLTSSY